jgi:hypothetical protein
VLKSIYAVPQTAAFTVSWISAVGVIQPATIVTAAPLVKPAPPAVPLKTWSCAGTLIYSLMSDGTFSVTSTGTPTCKETL